MDLATQLAKEAVAAARRLRQRRQEAISGLERRKCELELDIVRLTQEDHGADELGELRATIAADEARLAEARQQNAENAAALNEKRREFAQSLLPMLAELSARSGKAAVARSFDEATLAFRAELVDEGYAAESSSFAQMEVGLTKLVSVVDEARSHLSAAARSASDEITTFSAARARQEEVASRAREIEHREAAVLQRLAKHSPPQQPQLPLVASLLHADTRSLEAIRKHVLAPLLAQFNVEREQGFVGRDPLEEITSLGASGKVGAM
jgi:hypothetical protein